MGGAAIRNVYGLIQEDHGPSSRWAYSIEEAVAIVGWRRIFIRANEHFDPPLIVDHSIAAASVIIDHS
jgi:hypothetical protein